MIGHGKSDADRYKAVTKKFTDEARMIQQVRYTALSRCFVNQFKTQAHGITTLHEER